MYCVDSISISSNTPRYQGKYTAVYPMLTKADAGNSLVDFTDEVGIPQVLMTDLASEFSGQHTDFVKHCRRMRIQLKSQRKGSLQSKSCC